MKGPKDQYLSWCSISLRYKIKKVVPHKSWKAIFSNSWVLRETLAEIRLAVPADLADHAQETYTDKIQSLTGKSVEIIPGTDDMSDIRQTIFS